MSKTMMLVPRRSAPATLPQRIRAAARALWSGPLLSSDPALKKYFGSGYESASGITVTPQNAFTFSAVFDAVNQISSDVGKLPLNLLKRRPDGGSDQYIDSKLYRLLKHEPNPETGAMVMRRTLVAHALTCHGGYAEIERDGAGRPAAIWNLTPDRVEPIRRIVNTAGRERLGPLEYRIDGSDDYILSARDVLHIHGLGYDGVTGYSIIDKARQTIGLALAMEKFGATYFGKGTVFGGHLESDSDLDEDQKRDIKANIDAFRASQDSAWRILVTGAGHKFHQFDSKPRDSQMDESRIRQVEEVARFFRLPPHRLGVNTPGTVSYASVEAANLDYYTGCLLDWLTLVEQEFNRKLIAPLEQRQQFIKHNVNAFLRGTIKERYDALGIARDKGVINADEWRDLEDMNPQEGGQGKLYLVQSAQMPLNKLEELADAQIAKAKAPRPTQPAPATNQQVQDANDRAVRAEQLAAEARDARSEAEQRLSASQASGEARDEELARLRADVERTTHLATEMQAIAEYVRHKAEAITGERDTLAAQLEAETAARSVAEQAAITARDEAAAAIARAEDARDQAIAEASRAQQDAADAAERATESTAARDAAVSALAAAEQLMAEASTAAAEARAEAERAAADTTVARAEAERLLAVAAAADAARDAAQAERDTHATLAADAQAMADDARTTAAAADAERARLDAAGNAAIAAADRARAEAEAARDAAQAEAESARAAATAATERADSTIRAAGEADADRTAAVLSAHQALIADVMRRMIDREIDRLRRAQATPEKLRAALESFYAGHEELCQTALLPAIRVHLAWTRSTDDPATLTRRLVAQHIEESIRQVRTVMDGDADDLAVSLNALFRSWESTRVTQLANVILQRGIDHVRHHTH